MTKYKTLLLKNIGDLEKTESLVRNFGAPIDVVDAWQSSPLYYACTVI